MSKLQRPWGFLILGLFSLFGFAQISMEWKHHTLGSFIGDDGFKPFDLDKDGIPELLVSASFGRNDLWYVLKYSDGVYQQIHVSELYTEEIVAILPFDLDYDGRHEMIIALESEIRIYRSQDWSLWSRLDSVSPVTDFAVADLDRDAVLDLMVSDGNDLHVLTALPPHTPQWSFPGRGGDQVLVGNVDDDPAIEVVTNSAPFKNRPGSVIDGATRQVQWSLVNGFGQMMTLADTDLDGIEELVAGHVGTRVYDARTRTLLRSIPHGEGDAWAIGDTDGDGIPEILRLTGTWGDLVCLDIQTGAERWRTSQPGVYATTFDTGDFDRDGNIEVIWGQGGGSDSHHFFIYNTATQILDISPEEHVWDWDTLAIGDVDQDGRSDLIAFTTGFSEGPFLHQIDLETHEFKQVRDLSLSNHTNLSAAAVVNLDGTGPNEVVVGLTHFPSRETVVGQFDIGSGQFSIQTAPEIGVNFSFIRSADLEGDANLEVIAGLVFSDSGSTGEPMVIYDSTTMDELWRTEDLGGVFDLDVVDVNKDGRIDLVAVTGQDKVVVYDGVTRLKLWEQVFDPHDPTAVEVVDIDGDNTLEIIVADAGGTAHVYAGDTFQLETTLNFPLTYAMRNLKIRDLNGDGTNEWIVHEESAWLNDTMRLNVFNGSSDLLWQSPILGFFPSDILLDDVDGDQRIEIILGTEAGIFQFEVCAEAAIPGHYPEWPELTMRDLVRIVDTCPLTSLP